MDAIHNGHGHGHGCVGGAGGGGGGSIPREVECRVCGDKASGKHYGVPSCDGCRGFFKRSIRRNLDYICKESGNCIVDVTRRNQCQSCRFKKCLQVNMKRDAVQHERAPRINGLHKSMRAVAAAAAAGNPFHSPFAPGGLGGVGATTSLFFPGLHPGSHSHHSQHHQLMKHFSINGNHPTSLSSMGTPTTSLSVSTSSNSIPIPTSSSFMHPPPLGFYPFHHPIGMSGGSGSGLSITGTGGSMTNMLPLFPLSSSTAARLMFSAAAAASASLPPPSTMNMNINSFSTSNLNASPNGNENECSSDEEDDLIVDQEQEQVVRTKSSLSTSNSNCKVKLRRIDSCSSNSGNSTTNGSNNSEPRPATTTTTSTTTSTREEEVSTTTMNDQLEYNGSGSVNGQGSQSQSSINGSGGSTIISTSTLNSYPLLSSINDNIYESAAKLLFLSIKWARSVPSFCALPSSDQCALLAYSWAELFVLSAAQCGLIIEDSFYMGKTTHQLLNAKKLADLLTRITSLSPDHTELACMKAVVLFKPETPNLSSQLRLELLQDQTMIMLQEYCFAKSPLNKIRFGKLLLLFPTLKSISSHDLEELFFKQTVGEVSIQKLITDLVKSTF